MRAVHGRESGGRHVSGLRLYIHDHHGRHINGDVRVYTARTSHVCDGYRCDRTEHGLRGRITEGEQYAIATMYPSDDDFHWVDRDTLEPSKSAVRLKLCPDCISDAHRELLEVLEVGSAVRHQGAKE